MKQEDIPAIKAVLKDIPTTGSIELKALYFKDARTRIEPSKDKVTGMLKGVPRLSDEDKRQLTFFTDATTAIMVKDGYVIDFTKFEDRLIWAMIKESYFIAESFHMGQNTPGARFYINDEVEQLTKELEGEDLLFKVLSYIHNDRPDELLSRARILGVDMEGDTPDAAKKYLISVAKTKDGPAKLLNLYQSNVIALQLMFYKACDKSLIKKTNGIYMYGSLPLGVSDEEVISYLQAPSNIDLLDQLKKQLNPELYSNTALLGKDESRQKQ